MVDKLLPESVNSVFNIGINGSNSKSQTIIGEPLIPCNNLSCSLAIVWHNPLKKIALTLQMVVKIIWSDIFIRPEPADDTDP